MLPVDGAGFGDKCDAHPACNHASGSQYAVGFAHAAGLKMTCFKDLICQLADAGPLFSQQKIIVVKMCEKIVRGNRAVRMFPVERMIHRNGKIDFFRA